MRSAALALLLLVIAGPPARAEGPLIHGFWQVNYSPRLGEPRGEDFLVAEERLQLEASGFSRDGRLAYFAKSDVFHDWVEKGIATEVREAYVDYFAPSYHVRAGRQIITWGVGDLLFINDLFPKDWTAFFSGRPLEYLKLGSDAVKVDIYAERASFELVLTPSFRSDRLPEGDRFVLDMPFAGIPVQTIEPASTLDNTEVALRAYGRLREFDASLYLYRGYHRGPAMRPDDPDTPTAVSAFFPRLNVYGFSLQGAAWDGVLTIEGGYYDSRDDRDGDDPAIPNSQTRFLVGYSRQLAEDYTAGIQYYGEYTHDYSAHLAVLLPEFPRTSRFRQLVTGRLTRLRKHQTERLSLFAFLSPDDRDYLIIPEYRRDLSDRVWVVVGMNLFGGASDTFFGSLGKNDNLYVIVRRSF